MKKIFISLGIMILSTFFGLQAQEVEYHFQEGFVTSTPSGWARTCNATSSTVHTTTPPLSFAGGYAVKFDATTLDETFYLETPETANAGVLSFYIAKNANNTQMDLYICKIVNGVSTEIKTLDAFTIPYKSAEWLKVSINVNESARVKFRFYATVRSDNAGWFAIDDIELTKLSGIVEPPAEAIDKINTDFGDGTWGTILPARPNSGEFPSSDLNGFHLEKSAMVTGTLTGTTGIVHTNRIFLDKSSLGAAVEFPALKDVGEVEIHAVSGSDAQSFRLEELINNNWSIIDTYVTRKSPDSIYVITLNRSVETKLRIANNTSSSLVVYKILTHTYQETQELNVTGSTPAQGGTCYYNLTKNITITFNKTIDFGTGNILLNNVNIPVSSCTINENTVTIPATLEGSSSGKNYTLTIPQGAFAEKSNPSNLNNAKTITFDTYKTVAYPSGFSSQIDVLYSTADVNQNRMDIYYPTNSDKAVPIVINIHGGGWNHGEKESQSGFNTYFNMGFAVANIEYRMTPQATAPAALVDTRCALMYLLAHADELNIDVNKIIFQGGSAGGHLALVAAYLQDDNRFDASCTNYNGTFKIVAVIDKYGPSHLEGFMFYSSLVSWLGDYKDDAEFINSISPIKMVTANTPPTYIIHGDADPTVPYSQSEILSSTLQAAGVKYQFTTVPGGGHGGFTSDYNTLMNNEITAFLTQILDNATGIDFPEVEVKNLVSIVGDKISINIADDSQTEVYDISGKLIVKTLNKQISLNETGVFIVKIKTSNNTYTTKVLKNK